MSESNPGPQNLSATHRQIARWLLENPGKGRLKECADHFGYTQAWISTLIHSDAFEALMGELNVNADNVVVNDIPSKLRGVAALAIEGLGECVEEAMNDKMRLLHRGFLRETADMTLARLGYGSSKSPGAAAPSNPLNQQNNFFLGPVPANVLADARSRLLEHSVEVTPVAVPETRELSAGGPSPQGALQ